ncbi:MAG: GMC oxidoreductase, partial [Vicinamibacteria bacterium]
QAGRALVGQAGRILRGAGAWITFVQRVRTLSHALGTVRRGPVRGASPLDADCRLRGTDNLYVVDGSGLPTAAAVNPSLTIAAHALRAGERIAAASGRAVTAA